MLENRVEKDKLGQIEIKEEVLYGIQTHRAYENFKVDDKKVEWLLIEAIIQVKKAAVLSYLELKIGDESKNQAILKACEDLLHKKDSTFFITNPLQGGAGTSTNMNVNEVIANMALLNMGEKPGSYDIIHPLDHVNRGQSTNDVYPTALRIAAVRLVRQLSQECAKLQESLQHKEAEFESVLKLGRTELMDAMPITLGQEFGSYAQAIARDRWRIYKVEERLRQVNLGGTAVGTGSNADRRYAFKVIDVLREITDIGLAKAEYPMDITQNNDVFVEVSGLLKALAVNLMKIATDLRIMGSGPGGGLGEILLPELQMGSTIMPGKVNPVMPEMITQVAIKVMANDSAITIAAASGNFELNAFLPLIAESLLDSLKLLTNGVKLFREKCIEGIKADAKRCQQHLENSFVLVTSLTPYIGYDRAAELIQLCGENSSKENIIEIVLKNNWLEKDVLEKVLHYRSEIGHLT